MKAWIRAALDQAMDGFDTRHAERQAKRQAHNARLRQYRERNKAAGNVVELPVNSPAYRKRQAREAA
jgi:hypothetical protein